MYGEAYLIQNENGVGTCVCIYLLDGINDTEVRPVLGTNKHSRNIKVSPTNALRWFKIGMRDIVEASVTVTGVYEAIRSKNSVEYAEASSPSATVGLSLQVKKLCYFDQLFKPEHVHEKLTYLTGHESKTHGTDAEGRVTDVEWQRFVTGLPPKLQKTVCAET